MVDEFIKGLFPQGGFAVICGILLCMLWRKDDALVTALNNTAAAMVSVSTALAALKEQIESQPDLLRAVLIEERERGKFRR